MVHMKKLLRKGGRLGGVVRRPKGAAGGGQKPGDIGTTKKKGGTKNVMSARGNRTKDHNRTRMKGLERNHCHKKENFKKKEKSGPYEGIHRGNCGKKRGQKTTPNQVNWCPRLTATAAAKGKLEGAKKEREDKGKRINRTEAKNGESGSNLTRSTSFQPKKKEKKSGGERGSQTRTGIRWQASHRLGENLLARIYKKEKCEGNPTVGEKKKKNNPQQAPERPSKTSKHGGDTLTKVKKPN